MTIATGPEIGAPAPAFRLPAPGGEVALADHGGKAVVLYFYPKDDTPGCTTEALDFTAAADAFAAAGATVIGVSKDSVKSHEKFAKKRELRVALASDEHGTTCEDYGVWVEKSMYGKTYMGIERATFLIDGAGIVRGVWRKVKVKGHVDEVLEAARALG